MIDRNDEMIGILTTALYRIIKIYDAPLNTQEIVAVILDETTETWKDFDNDKKEFIIKAIKKVLNMMMEN